ncbi:MAG: UvrD-helicase domain-containing protein [Actinobacteria bacterium]|nr:UvrD-helicase domain-containing protein [Actinomycetota bacterium]
MKDKEVRENDTAVGSLPPDHAYRELITRELDRCILVEAAAGTGKTTSMIARMLALLRTGACGNIRTMAAVTFTRKAAAELRGRFQVALERAVRQAEGTDKERLEAALAHVEQCFIGTIHSFCARLLRERPVEAGVDLSFEEIDEEADSRLRAEAWDAFASELIVDDPHGLLHDLDRLGLRITDLRSAFEDFANFPDVQEWPLPPADVMPDCVQALGELESYLARIAKLAPKLPHEEGNDSLIPQLKRIPRIISHYDDLSRPDQLMEVLELFDKGARVVQKEWKKTGRFSADDAKGEQAAWESFREAVVRPALTAWRELRYVTVMRLMFAARERYDGLRRERGQLNFQDLLMRSAALLREDPTVRRYFQSRFSHLLVDEFQDTDPIQAEVIFLLTSSDPGDSDWRKCRPRPGSLFMVGDPKQSIYRFRRADIVTYNEAKQIVKASGGEVVNLYANFRAAPAIIAWVNGVFEPGEPSCSASGKALLRFPPADAEDSPSYVPLQAGREEGRGGELCGIYRLDIPEDFTRKEQIAEEDADLIARIIRDALDRGMTVPRTRQQLDEGMHSEVTPDDFMIITRNTTRLSTYARALQRYGIPHRVTGGCALNELEELRLLHTCLRAVVHPDDPAALVAALRSELFGVSDAALYAFKKAGGSFSYNAEVPELDPEHVEALEDAFSHLRRCSLRLARLPLVAACEGIARDLGLFALAAVRPGGDVQAGSLGKAIELLRSLQPDTWSAAQLVEHLDRLVRQEEKHDGISARSGFPPAVRIMNLHKVKGLEAPVVFLADPSGEFEHDIARHIDRSGGRILGYLATYKDGSQYGRGKLLAHPEHWESLAEREREFARAEALRLRYVAATRAGAATIITQRCRQNSSNPWCHFEPFVGGDSDLPDPGPLKPPVEEKAAITTVEIRAETAAASARLESVLMPTYDARGAKEYALSLPATAPLPEDAVVETDGYPPSTTGEHGVEWGEVIHLLLQAGVSAPEADLGALAAAALAEAGLPASLAAQAVDMARNVMGSEIWRRAMQSETSLVEVPFQILRDEGSEVRTILRGAIDLVFYEEGGWVLVDYKTDRLDSDTLREAADRYAAQLRLYAEAWERCSGDRIREALIYFTTTGTIVEVIGSGSDDR